MQSHRFMKPAPSPKLTDSPFPAFKSNYRYRGVYERAGFDVYKGPNGERIVRSRGATGSLKPMTQPQQQQPPTQVRSASDVGHFNHHQSNSSCYQSNTSSPTLDNYSRGSNPEINSYGNHPQIDSNQHKFNPYSISTNRNRSQGDLASNGRTLLYEQMVPHTAQGLTSSHNLDSLKTPRNYSGTTAVSSINDAPIVIKQDSQKVDNKSEFNFSPQPNGHKNYMNLSLDLNNKDIPANNANNAVGTSGPISPMDSDRDQLSQHTIDNGNSNDYDLNDVSNPSHKNDTIVNYNDDTNETSIDQTESIQTDELLETPEKRRQKNVNGLPTPPKSSADNFDTSALKRNRLSDALADFKHDFNPYHQPVIQVDEPRLSYNESNYSTPNSNYNPSSQFESFKRINNQDGDQLNTDYQNYLNAGGASKEDRKSQLSMVSSIISKESKYSDDDNNDSEVERELERQLQNLKTGGVDNNENNNNNNNSSVTMDDVNGEVPKRLRPSDPSLNNRPREQPVDNDDNDSQTSNSVHSLTQSSSSHSKQYPDQYPEEEPESSFHTTNNLGPYPQIYPEDQSPEIESQEVMQYSRSLNNTTDELDFTIADPNLKVDSISNNQVPEVHISESTPEQEKPINDNESLESIQPLSVRHSKSKTRDFELPDISKTPKVDQEQQQQINDNDMLKEIRMSTKSIPEFKYPSGSGPCRSCKEIISPDAKGSLKSIYSKTGELTGQWHRKCFTCSYDDCQIQFNKTTPCYVLDDEAYCDHHYHQLNNTLCDTCRIGIEGECIENELQQKWHLWCLKCFKCNHTIDSDYYLINDCIFCEADAINIISGQGSFNDGDGNFRNGLTTNDKIEKRRTRLMHVE